MRLRPTCFSRFLLFVGLFLFVALQLTMAASCPYCGRTYGDAAPGDEARVYALRAEHEANCPSRPRGGTQGRQGADAATYGAVTIFNQTKSPVAIQLQSKSGGRWVQATVQPGKSYYRWQSLPAQFHIRIPSAKGGTSTYSLDYNTVTGREPTWQDGRPFYISGTSTGLAFRPGAGSSARPKLSSSQCRCGGQGCHCLWDSCGKNGAARCGCGGKADCDCLGHRCPKFANTTACNGAMLCDSDGKWHCNRHGCPGGGGGKSQSAIRSNSQFAGTWTGSVRFGFSGTFHLTLKVAADEKSVHESGGIINGSHRVKQNNGTLSWRSGILNEVQWTLTPDADGRNATLTVKSPLGVNDTADFQRQPNQ